MADITMCSNTACPVRGDCYRACAKPSEYQSWVRFEPEYINTGAFKYCDHFKPITALPAT
jgi:hypothetical protein